jgi:hypothetical protein
VCAGIFDLEKPPDGRVEFAIRPSEALAVASFRWS